MSALFLLWHSPDSEKFWQCFQYAKDGSSLILLGDACYVGVAPNDQLNILKPLLKSLHCYALTEDLTKRNISYSKKFPIQLIDYEQFVMLTETHHPIITWN